MSTTDAPQGARSRQPNKHVVGRRDEIPPGSRVIVNVRGRSYGVFNINGTYHALMNRCPHQGGPLCKGPLHTFVEADGPYKMRFDTDRWLIACPWHGWEFDIATGQSYFEPATTRTRTVEVSVEEGDQLADADTEDTEIDPTVPGPVHGTVVGLWEEGPYKAETVVVSVEDEYVVLLIP
jgi:nitrite reductase/ring-hydroxylating ferredoxin subunit